MQSADARRYYVGVVAHGKVIAFGHHHLASIREQLFPTWLKSKRIVAFAENREQWEPAKWAC
jgi:hypothetical protein